MNKTILLEDRGVVEARGPDAGKFLHGLVTNDILGLAPGEARFAALLTPQGKILFDFLVFAATGERFFLDCPRALADDLLKRLSLYRLRAQVDLANCSDDLAVVAFEGDASPTGARTLASAVDPRANMGGRAIVARNSMATTPDRADRVGYEARRIRLGLPAGGVDFVYGDAFPHETNMDLLNGIDFGKGCYVGQEVVSRMKHRGGPRKRVIRYRVEGDAPPAGEVVRAGESEIGVTGSCAQGEGLALVRLDRLTEALANGDIPVAAGRTLRFDPPPA
jgi:folate-binding protein YgfZ